MSVLIACATELRPNLAANTSIHNIRRNPDDEVAFKNATRGDLARSDLWEMFRDSKHEWILWVDGDQDYPRHTLTRLLSHGKLCVSGLYFRREANPCFPIAFQDDPSFQWPLMPLLDWPKGELITCGATGFGAWLIHKSVLLDAQKAMERDYPGESLPLISDGQMAAVRGDRQRVGADLRLGYYIRKTGHKIWLDTGLPIGHCMDYFVGEEDYWRTHSNWTHRGYYGYVFECRMKKLREELKVASQETTTMVNSIIENLKLRIQSHNNALDQVRQQRQEVQNEIAQLQRRAQELQEKINGELNPTIITHDGARQEAEALLQAIVGGGEQPARKDGSGIEPKADSKKA